MATFGTLTLLLAFVVATYGGVASVVGAKRGNQRLIASGRGASYLLAAVLGLSSVALLYAFVSQDYSIKYVQHYSDASSPLFYRITAYWGGLDGSILWWVFLLSVFGAIAIHTNRHRHKEILPYAIATIMVVADFFLFLILYHKNPFSTFMGDAPITGNGLNPLLQNAYMITHPPSLYVGFVGMTIPFAFAMGSLISGHLDDAWIMSVRKWTIIAWFFLSMGLTLGMLWAYEELGWGGFWGWDPVENAGALPWFTATAFLHSIMIQERRGMMKIWNFTLVILTFLLTIFGTFMTRSGIVQSVHAFGQDTKLAWIFVGFMASAIVITFGILIWRLPALRSRGQLDSLLSREAAFLFNNWILVFIAFFVLFATMYPTLSEAISGERLTIGQPFFNKWMVPMGLTLLLLTGIGPLIAWRKASASNFKYQFTFPGLAALVTLVLCLVFGMGSSVAAVICFCFCAFTGGTITQEFVRGIRIRKKNTGSDVFSAFLGMLLRGRRRYGGYVVHVGIVLMFIGFGGQAYKKEKQVEMKAGQQIQFAGYTLKLIALRHEEDRQKEMITGEIAVFVRGKEIDRLQPAMWYYANKNNDRTTEVAIRRSPAEDLYMTLGNYDLSQGIANLELKLNPLVDWIWLGFMMLAFGTGIALLPERVLAPLAAKVKEDLGATATTAAVLLLAGALLLPGRAMAAPSQAQIDAEMDWFGKNLMCMCGCRHLLGDCGEAECQYAPKEFAIIRGMLEQGKTRDEVIQFFIAKYDGQSALAAPLDKGFNRLAWALPYGFGLAGAGGLAYGAWRFSRKPKSAGDVGVGKPVEAPAAANPDLEDKLDEELDKLD
ncbi:MAG: cytochrome c-type biogenesis CcmF C-terminal domain-containing protein [Deltaproteobacteria bacterium]|nr:cytochrome c-type biogenesis CcmF C-terminal domain-containing protein [Deltaproteobacteria bacterium]